MTFDEVNNMLNKKSGVLGISGHSSDFRDLEIAMYEGDTRSKLALDVFVNRVKKYVGAYVATLCRVDALVFTAGIGENSGYIRERICEGLECLGINKDLTGVNIMVIPTNEELMIARDTLTLVSK